MIITDTPWALDNIPSDALTNPESLVSWLEDCLENGDLTVEEIQTYLNDWSTKI